jgi:peptide deformylase
VLRGLAAKVAVEDIETPAFHALLVRMRNAMRAAPGVGLAAPQLGVPLQVFVLEDRVELQTTLSAAELAERQRAPFPLRIFINPTLRPVGDAQTVFFEGCLSVRGFTGLVSRSVEVEVSGLDEHGVSQTWRVSGWPARILQHEFDHLQGTLYVDRMLTRSFSTQESARQRFAGKSSGAILQELGLRAP